MSNRRSGRLAVALLTLIFAVPAGLAQKKNSEKTQDPSEKTRNVKPELNKAYKDWLEKDVAYIITDEERKAFKKLQTDDERERFIEEFWRRRDPDPDTDENEYREEYYERIANLGGIGMPNYQREQDSPFSRLQILTDLQRPPQIKFNDLASAVNTPVIEDNPLNFDVRVDFFRQSDERVITAFTVQTDNQNLVFKDSGGLQEATLNIFGKITHLSGRRAGVFEDPVTTRATPEELTEAKERKSAYQKAVALTPGRYRVDVIVRDTASGATGARHVGFEVPKYDTARRSTATLVLAR